MIRANDRLSDKIPYTLCSVANKFVMLFISSGVNGNVVLLDIVVQSKSQF